MFCRSGINLQGNFKFKLLHIYENFVEVFSSTEVVEQIISGFNEWDVEIEITFVVLGVWSS